MSGAITTDSNILVNRDYTDNFSIKETAMNNLGPKYFPGVDLSGLNVGELGFVLEQIANITEDSFNTASLMMSEAFPNKAVIPESIYSHAAVFQLNDAFVTCSTCSFIFLLQQSDVLTYGENVDNKIVMYIDKNTTITVSDENNNLSIPFMLDYDIKITAIRKNNEDGSVYDYSAEYTKGEEDYNSISDINDPYLKIRTVGNDYLILQFTAHQIERTEITLPITNNSKINYPVLTFDFNDDLAGMDIFYREPGESEYKHIDKLIKFSLPIKTPFCYYKLKDSQTMEITFTSREGYFQPEFNSEIKIVMYTTLGKKAYFPVYNGSAIDIQMNTEKYEYNNSIIISAKVVSGCTGGTERMKIDELKALTVEAYSSATEISNENDITRYFYNYKYRYGNEIFVVKKRDDIAERLFSAFLLLKNGSYIYPTNTVNLMLNKSDFDETNDNIGKFTLKPGHVFVYNGDYVRIAKDDSNKKIMAYNVDDLNTLMGSLDNEGHKKYLFAYTNPFLISVNKQPNAVGIYKTVISHEVKLDHISSNAEAFTHFITSKIHISRGLENTSIYKLSVSVIPSVSLEPEYKTDVRVIVGLVGSGIDEVGYVELPFNKTNDDDPSNGIFLGCIMTNDEINSKAQFKLLTQDQGELPGGDGTDKPCHIVKIQKSDDNYIEIPIADATLNVYILHKREYSDKSDNKFIKYEEFKDISDFTIVNMYSTKSEKVTFIEPMNMMRSTVLFDTNTNGDLTLALSQIPVVKADMVQNTDSFGLFVDTLTENYRYIEQCLPRLRNNTHIDIKFYNTYGKSSNYFIGDDTKNTMDRVNIVIKFKVTLVSGVDDISVKQRLKDFIKNFIEQLNTSGDNSLYISNLIREMETNFAEIHHLKFMGINEYGTNYQTISVKTTDLQQLEQSNLRKYVPEMLVADVELYMDVEG